MIKLQGARISNKSGINVEKAILSIRNKAVVLSKANVIRVKIAGVQAAITSSPDALIRVKLNPDLAGPVWADHGGASVVEYDVTSPSATGGSLVHAMGCPGNSVAEGDLHEDNLIVHPGETLTVTVESLGTAIGAVVAINWLEQDNWTCSRLG